VSWHPITNLSHLMREGMKVQLDCSCGHRALVDPGHLRRQIWQRAGSEELASLPRHLKCSQCGGKSVVARVPDS
tara:strand:- start:564 stop:785 length:222 start_codon:yes stop_codon:yes gene_type:complete